MPLSAQELARRRIVNQAAHYADKKANARTPLERATAAWDRWRGLVRALPTDTAGPWAEALTATLDTHIDQLNQLTTIVNAKGDRT